MKHLEQKTRGLLKTQTLFNIDKKKIPYVMKIHGDTLCCKGILLGIKDSRSFTINFFNLR